MSKRTARLVYVATPYAGLRCSEENRTKIAKEVALKECKRVKEAGYIPVSPILMWGELFDENSDRKTLLTAGLELLSVCSYVYFSSHPSSAYSAGMRAEREYAKELGISEIGFFEE